MSGRTVFATSRAADFFDPAELHKQTGQPVERFGDVVVKELTDNALDGAETTGAAPEVTLACSTDRGGWTRRIVVADNGPGMSQDLITRILDYNVLVSDKAAYRGVTRGAQGNAWKTLLGMPFASGLRSQPVVIESCGLRHEIAAALVAGQVTVRHDITAGPAAAGTRVEIPLAARATGEVDLTRWGRSFSAFNPHATIRVNHGDNPDGTPHDLYKSQVSGSWAKPLPGDKASPWWYDGDAMTKLVFAYIGHAKTGGADLPLGEFLALFDGMSRSATRKAVRAAVPGITHLSGFEKDPGLAVALLKAMKSAVRQPKPETLGTVTDEHMTHCLQEWYGATESWTARKRLSVHGVPWVIECAVAATDEPGQFHAGINYSPAFRDPLTDVMLSADGTYARSAGSMLTARDAYPAYGNGYRRAALLHFITPAAAGAYADRGKTSLHVPTEVAEAAAGVLAKASRVLNQQLELRRRNADAARRAEEKRQRQLRQEEPQWTLKAAVAEVMTEAIRRQRGGTDLPFSARSLFYKIRPLVQAYTDAELTDTYCTQQLLPEWQREHGVIEGLYYEARGELHEPHGGQTVALGTREVRLYRPPGWCYDKILVVEKAGLWPVLMASRIADRYDMAVITSEGFSSTACRAMLADLPAGCRVFSLHDADIAGYNLSAILGEETRRMPGHQVEVTDLGLTVAAAIELGLPPETFARQKKLPARLEPRLTPAEREWFGGREERYCPGTWTCQRVELNAFSSPGLIAYIESGLQAAGATAKVIPPHGEVERQLRAAHRAQIAAEVERIVTELAGCDEITRQVIRRSGGWTGQGVKRSALRAALEGNRAQPWQGAVRSAVDRRLERWRDGADVRELVRGLMLANLQRNSG